jgi:hypothetical protein
MLTASTLFAMFIFRTVFANFRKLFEMEKQHAANEVKTK